MPALGREALEIAQWADQSSAAAALQQMAARFAAGGGALAALVRKSQDLAARWREQDKALVAALSKPEGQQNRAAIETCAGRSPGSKAGLPRSPRAWKRNFPTMRRLANPKPLKAEEVQQLLGADEALVFFLTGDKESYVFALTREGFGWKTIPLGRGGAGGKSQPPSAAASMSTRYARTAASRNCSTSALHTSFTARCSARSRR